MNNFSHKLIDYHQLIDFVKEVFLHHNFSNDHALLSAQLLCKADVRGIDSHGVARLTGFLRLIEKGRINPTPNFTWTSDRLSAASLDADASIGLISAQVAMKKAIEKAKVTGCAFIGVSNSNHFGIAASHSEMAASEGLIGWAMTNASPLVSPMGSTERIFGTNPISIAVPNPLFGNGNPFVLDMATSAAANGKLEIAKRKNKKIPKGWAIDQEGNETDNPSVLQFGGALIPLGSDWEHGVHKGYGLGAVVDILSGVLTGANFGPWVPPFVAFLDPLENLPGKGIGHFVGAMDIAAFSDPTVFYEKMKRWSERIKSATTTNPNEPLIIHGEPEFETEKYRKEKGIPLNHFVYSEIKQLSQKLNIKTPLFEN